MRELDLYCLGSSYWIQVKVPYLYTKSTSHNTSQKYESKEIYLNKNEPEKER